MKKMSTNEKIEEIRNILNDRFKGLEFQEEGHKYSLNGVNLPSVSSIVERFCHVFDADSKAIGVAKRDGKSVEEILREWKYENLKSTITGTLVHEFGESMAWMRDGNLDGITESCKCKYDKTLGTLIPTRKKEEAIVSFFNDLPENYRFVTAEARVHSLAGDLNLKNPYCGTFDLLIHYEGNEMEGLILFDYKNNKTLTKDYARNKKIMMLPPFDDMYDEPLGHYTVQQSLYQLCIESVGLKVIGRRLIHVKDDGTYQLYRLNDVTEKLKKIL